MIKRSLFFLIAMLLGVAASYACHMMGGEITWVCQGNGQYVFKMTISYDCNAQRPQGNFCPADFIDTVTGDNYLTVFNNPELDSIEMFFQSSIEISPECNGEGISCAAAANGQQDGAIELFFFQSAPTYLPGVPPSGGWIFAYCRQGDTRNPNIMNIQYAQNYGLTFRAIMYPYNGINDSTCFDASPTFSDYPAVVNCVSNPIHYNPGAYQADLDSFSYSWAAPLDQFPANLSGTFDSLSPPITSYYSGYSDTNPLPGPASECPNCTPATLNPATGEISFKSYISGYFTVVIKVSGYRCGVLVSEIFREMELVLINCGVDPVPVIAPPFNKGTSYADTVTAGDFISFPIVFTDPLASPQQKLTITAIGSELGTADTSATTGCLNAPCATLSSSLPVSGTSPISVHFNWQTACNHLSLVRNACGGSSSTYNFVFKVQDNVCPYPQKQTATVSITIVGKSAVAETVPIIGDTTVYTDSSYTYRVSPVSGATSYTWALPSGWTGPSTLESMTTKASSGGGTLSVIANDSCGGSSAAGNITVHNATGIITSNNRATNYITVYPNPSKGKFTIQANSQLSPGIPENFAQLSIYNMLGERIYFSPLTINNSSLTIDLSSQPQGIYFMQVQTEGGLITKKVVIE